MFGSGQGWPVLMDRYTFGFYLQQKEKEKERKKMTKRKG